MAESVWDEPSRRASLRLCLVPGVGPRLRERLLDAFGDAESVFRQAPASLRTVDGIGGRTADAIAAAHRDLDVDQLLRLCRDEGIRVDLPMDDGFPMRLREIPSPPGALFSRGEWSEDDRLAVAIVGTRGCSNYGRRQSERFAQALADRGVTIVSGLARGIDAAAHRGALNSGGRTIAVLGSGLLRIYPPEHRDLMSEVARHGVVVSEYSPMRPPKSSTFPQRNRIISGLSWGVLVIEAGRKSGALVTARHALEQNREVLALPGPVESGRFAGSHGLLRDGAQLVESPEEVLESLGPLPAPIRHHGAPLEKPAELNLSEQQRQVLNLIGGEPTSIDRLISVSGLPAPRVLATLTMLEMRALVARVSGQFVVRR